MPLWLHLTNPWDREDPPLNLDLAPAPTIAGNGLWGGGHGQYFLRDDGMSRPPTAPDKPPYRVPSMSEVRAVPPNGFRVVSTFAGCGGSSLGYRMAGFRVVWANEFHPHALE